MKFVKVPRLEMVETSLAGIEYLFFRQTPFCTDGYKEEMEEKLRKKGWQIGMGSLTYKEGLSFEEFLDCFAFGEAYRKIFEEKVPNPLANIDLSISEFLNLVDKKSTEIRNDLEKKGPKIDNIFLILENFGFKPEDTS